MRFGVFCLSQAPEGVSPAQALEWELGQIEYAEELGFDSVWLAEHHFTNYCVVNDPLTYAAHVAARTSKIQIGLAVCVLPLHNPLEIAERSALVDLLSHGRLNLGVGSGYAGAEFAAFGVPLDQRRARYREALEIIIKCWTEENFDYDGRFWRLRNISLYPKPLQRPHPPVFIASTGSPETVALAASRGFPILQGDDFLTPQKVASRYQLYRQLGQKAGRSPEESESALRASAVRQQVYVAETREAAQSIPGSYVMWKQHKVAELLKWQPRPGPVARLRRRLRPLRHPLTGNNGVRGPKELGWQDLLGYDLYGTPDVCIQRIQQLAAVGVDNILCWFAYGGLPDELVRKSMKLFAREVMPVFQSSPVTTPR